TCSVATLAGMRFTPIAGHNQQDLPGRGRRSVSLGATAGDLSIELCYLLRQLAVVCAVTSHVCPDRCNRSDLLGTGQRNERANSVPDRRLFCGVVHLLPGLPWPALSTQAGSRTAHSVLSHDRRGRRPGWIVCCPVGPTFVHVLL